MPSHRRIIVAVVVLAALIRVWFLGVPLVITNDGTGYLQWATMILEGMPIEWPVFRTPGYPLFLSLVFLIGGMSPIAVLVAQHALGVAIAGMLVAASLRLAGTRMAVVVGVVAALDPWLLGFASYALTETLSAFLLVLAVVLAVTTERPSYRRAAAIGIVLGGLVLVRPAFQIVLPMVLLGWVLAFSIRSRRSLVTGALIAATFAIVVAPWLWHNQQRGIRGFSGGSKIFLWIGVAGAGLLDEHFPLPDDVRASYDRHVRPAPAAGGKYTFLGEVRAWYDPERAWLMTDWAMHSIRRDPGRWGRTVLYAVGWQLSYFPRRGPITNNATRWLLQRLTQDGRAHGMQAANFQFDDHPDLSRFAMNYTAGPQRHYLLAAVYYRDIGLWHGLLLVVAGAASLMAAYNGRWLIAAALGSTICYSLMHAVFLLPYDRFSFPCWMAWYVAPGALVAQIRLLSPQEAASAAAPL